MHASRLPDALCLHAVCCSAYAALISFFSVAMRWAFVLSPWVQRAGSFAMAGVTAALSAHANATPRRIHVALLISTS